MHSQSYSSSNRLPYFFDPRLVLTLGSLARTTVVPWEFRQFRFCGRMCSDASKPRLTRFGAVTCAERSCVSSAWSARSRQFIRDSEWRARRAQDPRVQLVEVRLNRSN